MDIPIRRKRIHPAAIPAGLKISPPASARSAARMRHAGGLVIEYVRVSRDGSERSPHNGDVARTLEEPAAVRKSGGPHAITANEKVRRAVTVTLFVASFRRNGRQPLRAADEHDFLRAPAVHSGHIFKDTVGELHPAVERIRC